MPLKRRWEKDLAQRLKKLWSRYMDSDLWILTSDS